MNPILQALNQNPNNIMQMMNMVRNSRNPQAMLMQMAKQNPQMKQVMDYANAVGDPKTAFYKMAEQKGVDPNSILSMLK